MKNKNLILIATASAVLAAEYSSAQTKSPVISRIQFRPVFVNRGQFSPVVVSKIQFRPVFVNRDQFNLGIANKIQFSPGGANKIQFIPIGHNIGHGKLFVTADDDSDANLPLIDPFIDFLAPEFIIDETPDVAVSVEASAPNQQAEVKAETRIDGNVAVAIILGILLVFLVIAAILLF